MRLVVGLGNPGAGYARIGGQHSTYTANQLKLFRTGERSTGANAQMMTAVASVPAQADDR